MVSSAAARPFFVWSLIKGAVSGRLVYEHAEIAWGNGAGAVVTPCHCPWSDDRELR